MPRPFPCPSGAWRRARLRAELVAAAWVYPRWLTNPAQWTIRAGLGLAAVASALLVLARAPRPVFAAVAAVTLAALAAVRLPRFGYRLVDVAAVLALLAVASALLFPAMQDARARTFGGRFFPKSPPVRFVELVVSPE